MEPTEAISEGEWSSLSGFYTTAEEAHFMAQLLRTGSVNTELGGSWLDHDSTTATFSASDGQSSFYHSNVFPQSGAIFPPQSGDDKEYYLDLSDDTNPMIVETSGGGGSGLIGSGLVREPDFLRLDVAGNSIVCLDEEEGSRKRPQSTAKAQKMKRNMKLKKSQSFDFSSQMKEHDNLNDKDDEKVVKVYKRSSSDCCPVDDQRISKGRKNEGSGSSLEDPTAISPTGKTRASRGSATDPQSLYARKRRERINERLKILQSLVPNGTKVDISTMLEEAVHYVKFLQLQIKLLSSDDMWMYAPIAYNGIDIGLKLKINSPR